MVDQSSGFIRHYAEPIWEFLTRDDVIEIAVNPDGRVWIETRGDSYMQLTDVTFREDQIVNLSSQIAGQQDSTAGRETLIISAMLDAEGTPVRVQSVYPKATQGIGSITIRKFPKHQISSDKIEIIHRETPPRKEVIDDVIAKFQTSKYFSDIADDIVKNHLTVVISGGTGSGKTTLLKALLEHVPKQERVITIEDVPEIIPNSPNYVGLQADRDKDNRSPKKLLESVMRMRPDRFLIGELRGDETRIFVEAVNTGHPGSFTTVHANSAELAVNRLVLMGMGGASNISASQMAKNICDSIDLIIHAERIGEQRGPIEIFSPLKNVESIQRQFV